MCMYLCSFLYLYAYPESNICFKIPNVLFSRYNSLNYSVSFSYKLYISIKVNYKSISLVNLKLRMFTELPNINELLNDDVFGIKHFWVAGCMKCLQSHGGCTSR